MNSFFCRREVFPDGILYASKESHYSVFKAARMYRMECVKVDTLISGEINCVDFKDKLLANKDKPAIINVNIGISTLSSTLTLLQKLFFPFYSVFFRVKLSDPVTLQERLSRELLMTLILLYKLLKKVGFMIGSTYTAMEHCSDL